MNDVLLAIPGEALAAAKIPRSRLKKELKKELALQLSCAIPGLSNGGGSVAEFRSIDATEPAACGTDIW